MSLSLVVTSYKGHRPGQPLAVTLDQDTATIGRLSDNTLVLPDAENYISGHHAKIEHHGLGYTIADTSANGVYLNSAETALGRGNTAHLSDDDCLTIGEYIIAVQINDGASEQPDSGLIDDPFSELGLDPIKNLLDKDESNIPDWETDSGDTIPENMSYSTESDHTPVINEAFTAPVNTENSVDLPADWFAKNSKPQPSHKAPPPKVSERPSQDKEDLSQALISNFMKGAGLDEKNFPDALTPQLFHQIGAILRSMVHGTIDILISRGHVKNEMHLNATTVQRSNNNPIKFSINADEALKRLLAPLEHGYMDPVEAVGEAFDDLKAHQIAVLAGMQSALQSVLSRFNPGLLEQRLQKHNPIGANIPIHKQAKLWTLFEQLYEDIEREAEDDFSHLFGQAFARAYDEQIKQLSHTD